MSDKNWELAVMLRGKSFHRNLETYRMLTRLKPPAVKDVTGWNLAVMHIGAPCCGMNAAVRSFVRNCIYSGNNPIGIENGLDGLMAGEVKPLQWSDVTGWVSEGGALLGTRRTLPEKNYAKCAEQLAKYKIQGLVVIGGFEAFHAVLQLHEAREKYKEFRIPMVVLPATISNNVPGTDFSIGADTALNEITEICDRYLICLTIIHNDLTCLPQDPPVSPGNQEESVHCGDHGRLLRLPGHHGGAGGRSRRGLHPRGELRHPGADEGPGHHGLQDGQGQHLQGAHPQERAG